MKEELEELGTRTRRSWVSYKVCDVTRLGKYPGTLPDDDSDTRQSRKKTGEFWWVDEACKVSWRDYAGQQCQFLEGFLGQWDRGVGRLVVALDRGGTVAATAPGDGTRTRWNPADQLINDRLTQRRAKNSQLQEEQRRPSRAVLG